MTGEQYDQVLLEEKIMALEKEIVTLKTETKELKKSLSHEAEQHGLTRQRVTKLESYLTIKNNGNHRRDFELLAVELRKEVLRRGKYGMCYSDVMSFFRFKGPAEAYRLMEICALSFHDELRLVKPQTRKQKFRILPFG